mgnify:FL=1|tara:strand:- start:637 stop:825 length:189 start_codon:yes stop_codon:yes gene_type:complete
MIYCVNCKDEIVDIIEHYTTDCKDMDLSRLLAVGLITAEERNIINSIRNEKRTASTVPSPKQ